MKAAGIADKPPARQLAGLAALGTVAAVMGAGATVIQKRRGRVTLEKLRQTGRGGEARTVTTSDGIKLHVEIDGPDDASLTVIFAHGWTMNLTFWREQRAALFDQDVRRVFYDQRCHGQSEPGPMDAATGPQQLARDLYSVLEAVGPTGPVVLVGHSMGSLTIITLAEVHPELFGSRVVATLLVTALAGDSQSITFGLPTRAARLFHTHVIDVGRTLGRYPGVVSATGLTPYRMIARNYMCGPGATPQARQASAAIVSATPLAVTVQFLAAFMPWNGEAGLPALGQVRTVILAGEHDKFMPPSHTKLLAQQIPGAELVWVDSGHMIPLERPQVVNAHLVDVVVANSSSTGGTEASGRRGA